MPLREFHDYGRMDSFSTYPHNFNETNLSNEVFKDKHTL